MAAPKELTTYVALFHHRDHAASAIRDLEAAGFSREALTVIGGTGTAGPADQGSAPGSQDGLAAVGVPEQDRKHLEDGLARGGVVLALQGAAERAEEIERYFSEHSLKKIDEREIGDNPGGPAAIAEAASRAAMLDAAVIPVVQEELVVGTREVDRGGVRVLRHVVEEPVTESVNLREERVIVERLPVDRLATDADAFRPDRVIELRETAEEAVIGKTARVVEEVHVGKVATEHTEPIDATVRRTEVEIEPREPIASLNPNQNY